VLNNSQILQNEAYFESTTMPMVIKQFKQQQNMNLTPVLSRTINGLLIQEYINEYNGVHPW